MAKITLPYQLQDGQKAYAAKLMANFNALRASLNTVAVEGLAVGDMAAVLNALKQLIDNCVIAYQGGNAAQVRFADGDSVQDKLDAHQLKAELVNLQLNGMYSFFVDAENGHLCLSAPADADQPPFAIGENGHLTYTVPDAVTESSAAAVYDLGNVRGIQGLPGDMDASVYDPTGQQKDVFAAIDEAVAAVGKSMVKSVMVYAPSWNAAAKQVQISVAGLAADSNFAVEAAYSATDAELAAWRGAMPRIIDQAEGQFTIRAYGMIPEADIPLSIVVLP